VRRTLILAGFTSLVLNLVSLGSGRVSLREDTSRAALASLGQEYGDVQVWVTAIAATTDTLPSEDAERARVLAHQLARVIEPLERDFENTTASLSTAQLEQILPLWERMAFAHAGFTMLEEQAVALGKDPALDPAELHELVTQLSAVLDFAAEIQRLVLTRLTTPSPTPIRIS
jgi:hypothetical protein